MSALVVRALLQIYPRAWRDRYGEELTALMVRAGGDGRRALPLGLDVALAGCRERLRAAGLTGDGLSPHERARGGLLIVLWAWAIFIVGGIGVEKSSEQWATAVTGPARNLPRGAFDSFIALAAVASLLVVAAIGLTAGSLRSFLRSGGWTRIRRPIAVATALSLATGAGLVPIAVWAHRLSEPQRNGHDPAYAGAILAWILVFVACIAAWTVAAVVTARQIELSRRLLRIESLLAIAVSSGMVLMTAATAVWWGAVARSAPWFLAGTRAGSTGTAAPPNLLVAVLLMAAATVIGLIGAARARHNLSLVADSPS